MRYHLGEFRPAPDPIGSLLRTLGDAHECSPVSQLLPRLVRILAQWDHSPEGVLEELLGGSSANGAGFFGAGPRRMLLDLRADLAERRRAPDLLDAPGLDGTDRAWTRALYEELLRSGPRRAGLRLVECAHVEGPAGYVVVAGIHHHAVCELGGGDTVHAGFVALRRAGGPLRVWPRVHRAARASSLVLPGASGSEELEAEGGLAAVVARCLTAAVAEKHARRLRAAARTPVAAPGRLLAGLGPAQLRARAEAAWLRSGDASLLGAVEALASLARAEGDFAQRVQLERRAGRLLERAALFPPRPSPRAPLPQLGP